VGPDIPRIPPDKHNDPLYAANRINIHHL